jgi:hypothetical protein
VTRLEAALLAEDGEGGQVAAAFEGNPETPEGTLMGVENEAGVHASVCTNG